MGRTRSWKDYYNDNEPYVARWLRNLIDVGLIPRGDVDEKKIQRVRPQEVEGYRRCHFFAGVAGWSLALELAGWPEDREVWTGSCPCQPFSCAGKRKGTKDERHLWPFWRDIIAERMPDTIFGEQVASPAGRIWLAGVQIDLEGLGYSFGAADLCAAGVGAPHIRQRLWWVADTDFTRKEDGEIQRGGAKRVERTSEASDVRVANAERNGRKAGRTEAKTQAGSLDTGDGCGINNGMADAKCDAQESRWSPEKSAEGTGATAAGAHAEFGRCGMPSGLANPQDSDGGRPGEANDIGWWIEEAGGSSFVYCADGKARRVGKRLQWMDDGVPDIMASSSTSGKNKEGEQIDAAKKKIRSDQALHGLREDVEKEAIQRTPGRFKSISEAEILRQNMYGSWDGRGDQGSQPENRKKTISQTGGGCLRDVRESGSSTCSSQRRESAEHRSPKPDDVVRFLSQTLALGIWEREIEAVGAMSHLLATFAEVGILPETLSAIPQVWRSQNNKTRQRIGSLLCERGARWVLLSPLVVGEKNRVGKLRAYGNAIVPQVAAEFVMAFMGIKGI